MSSTSRQPEYHCLARIQKCRWHHPIGAVAADAGDHQLLSQTHVLRYQQRLRLEERHYLPGDPKNHQYIPLIGIAAGVFHPIGLRGSGSDEVIAPYMSSFRDEIAMFLVDGTCRQFP